MPQRESHQVRALPLYEVGLTGHTLPSCPEQLARKGHRSDPSPGSRPTNSLAKGEGGGTESFKVTSVKVRKVFFWEGDERRGVMGEGAGEKLQLAPSYPSPQPIKKEAVWVIANK